MFSEKDFVNWLGDANPEKLRQMVRNNESLIQYAKNFPSVLRILRLAKPFIKYNLITLDVDKVMNFLRQNRPDLYAIVTREWVRNQIDKFKEEIRYL